MSIYLSRSSWGRPADGENCCSISFTDLKGYQAPWEISCESCYTLEGIFIVKKFVLTFSEWLQRLLSRQEYWSAKFENNNQRLPLLWQLIEILHDAQKMAKVECHIFIFWISLLLFDSDTILSRIQSIFDLIRLEDGTTIWSSRRLMVQCLFW